jgi:hypothetical protein
VYNFSDVLDYSDFSFFSLFFHLSWFFFLEFTLFQTWKFQQITSQNYLFILIFSIFIIVLKIHCAIYKILTVYHTWIHLSTILLYRPFLHTWNSFNSSHFSIQTCMHSICTIFTILHPFPTYSHFPLVTNPPRQDLFHLLFSEIVKERKWHFCLR